MHPTDHLVNLPSRTYLFQLLKGLSWIFAYAAWIVVFRLLSLTFITYFLMSSSHSAQGPRFEDISEAFAANELSLMGLGAVLFVVFMRSLNPHSSSWTGKGTSDALFTPVRFEKRFLPGFAHGAWLSAGIALAFVLSGTYRYLGFFVQFEEAPLAAATVLVRIMALGAFAYFEEFIFRHKVMRGLHATLWGSRPPTFPGAIALSLILALIYAVIKELQFDLGVMQLVTLVLISLALSMRTLNDASKDEQYGDFSRGAGFWAAILIVFQGLLSLPVLGSDFSGFVLIKYQGPLDFAGEVDPFTRLITGGAGGPLSSFALQLLLSIDVVRAALHFKKRLPKASS